jgi:flagellar protein FliS
MSALKSVAAAAASYQNVQARTCSPAMLVKLLLDGAFRFATEAEAAMKVGDRARTGERIGRCHAVLEELAASLDPVHSPELCENLLGIYTFAMRRLTDANLKRDPEALVDVQRVLSPLREAWTEIAKNA